MRAVMLFAGCFATWLLWAVAASMQKPAGRGVSVLPVIPFFPLLAGGAGLLADRYLDPWGTRVVGAAHALLALAFVVSIARNARDRVD